MLTFDKLKIVSNISNIEIIDETHFKVETKDGYVVTRKYHNESPYLLDIKIDYIEKELVIEFSGRILGKDYPKLISIKTIGQCFTAINDLGFCHLDIESMMDADVVKCDVTKDIKVDNVPQLTTFLRNHNNNYQRVLCRKMNNSNLTIEKNVTTKKLKKRMVVYDKEKEMNKTCNKQFVEDNALEGAFDGKCRFELNLNSKEQIRASLGITNTKLKSVLTADANPILDFLDDIVGPPSGSVSFTDKKAYLHMLVLKDCDFDLEKVEAKMRDLYPSRGTNFKKVMEPYKMMMEQMGMTEGQDYWKTIRDQLT